MTTMKLDRETMTTETNSMVCAVCKKHKHQLRARKSKLKANMTMAVCNDCFAGKYEPRWLVILIGQRDGLEAVQEYLIPKRYVGDEIPASDLVK